MVILSDYTERIFYYKQYAGGKMKTEVLIQAAERLKQGLIAIATNGEYPDKDYKEDIRILMTDQRIVKMIPHEIRVNRNSMDFRRAMQAKYQHYAQRRQYIAEILGDIFQYLYDLESGKDRFETYLSTDDLGEKLGEGGFGTVYKYHHNLLDMDFAIKLFGPVFVSDEENLEGEKRFFREAKILFSLTHPNIIRIYDIGRYNGQPYIRMEYVEGMTMQKYIDQYGALDFRDSLHGIVSLLRGLRYAHKVGVIHRDLKPGNFMCTKDGKFKIIDFGISAYLNVGKYSRLTKAGQALAGGAYTDPKLIESPELRDVRSDIYSVGAIWYYMLTGHPPMGGDLMKVLQGTGHATEEEAGIVFKCMATRLEDRYQSCDQVLDVIRKIVQA